MLLLKQERRILRANNNYYVIITASYILKSATTSLLQYNLSCRQIIDANYTFTRQDLPTSNGRAAKDSGGQLVYSCPRRPALSVRHISDINIFASFIFWGELVPRIRKFFTITTQFQKTSTPAAARSRNIPKFFR